MSDLDELYQSIILDHNKRPRHYGALTAATHQAEGYNPLCGDKVQVYLKIADNSIEAIQFESASCAICKASASMMVQALAGEPLGQIDALQSEVREFLEGVSEVSVEKSELAALQGVRNFPARIKCAKLPWDTLAHAIESGSR